MSSFSGEARLWGTLASSIPVVFAAASIIIAPPARAGDAPTRGLYWNYTDVQTLGGTGEKAQATIAEIKSLGIGEIHIWLNDNQGGQDVSCGATLKFGARARWNPQTLRLFTAALIASGIKPVFTFSPLLQTQAFIDSVTRPDGPVAIAAEQGGVPIELDVEGNWTEKDRIGPAHRQCAGTIETSAASALLLKQIKDVSPHSLIIISTTDGKEKYHSDLLLSADVISPQLYGEHYAIDATTACKTLKHFTVKYSKQKIRPALSLECSRYDAKNHGCGKTVFDEGVKMVLDQQARGRVGDYVIWARNEAKDPTPNCKPVKGADVCSTFGMAYLRRTALTPPMPATPSRCNW